MSDRDREREREIDKRVLYFVVSKSWWCFSFVMKAIIYERERERESRDGCSSVGKVAQWRPGWSWVQPPTFHGGI